MVDILLHKEFPLYAPYDPRVDQFSETLQQITFQTIREIFPMLAQFSELQSGKVHKAIEVEEFCIGDEALIAALMLKNLFDFYTSDKSATHNYHLLYGTILQNPASIKKVVEIGLGTNNVDVISNMGSGALPGASHRAFRDFLPEAKIYGGDIDRGVLFTEERIETSYVDQLNPFDMITFAEWLPDDCDLIIDDGLHSIQANLNSLIYLLPKIKIGGWLVIEDIIHPSIESFWRLVAALISNEKYNCQLIRTQFCLVFTVNRLQ